MAWDSAGRLFIAEKYTYAERPLKFDLNLRDRILIFEDRDGDGHFDSRKVFTDEYACFKTGLGRDNLDYLLDNILDPSAVVAGKENRREDFR